MTIKEVSEQLGITQDTLRYYVKYGIDKNVCSAFAEIDIIGLDECERFDDVDCIVVTPVHVYEKIKKELEIKSNAEICSVDDVLSSM